MLFFFSFSVDFWEAGAPPRENVQNKMRARQAAATHGRMVHALLQPTGFVKPASPPRFAGREREHTRLAGRGRSTHEE